MPGLLNPMMYQTEELAAIWNQIQDKIPDYDGINEVQKLLLKSPLEDEDILEITSILIFYQIEKSLISKLFSLRKDVSPNYKLLINDVFDLLYINFDENLL